ncbi:Cell surface protein [Fervidicola ferrireducens]|uniref:Cell surface protein n=1 Tax=Fervidicola ferrireducens TaxID=520764 RepID=A0A140L1K1_9FIRM|nr:S-layer homology domain-containing protein [Fervidicola ferrireducens]KXG74426.1 Cell surface protein [Fervidicola ferrireducens]
MKRFKKALALVVVFTLVLGLMPMAFASVPQDIKGTKYEKAVETLMRLGVVNGYPDGTYKPERVVTRAEMAKLLVVSLGLEDAAKLVAGTTPFKDVTTNHWATGYINIAANLGVIKGYPDGTFKPEAVVSYPEAVTMLVRALGYKDTDLPGTWPTNYISKAVMLGVTKGVTVALTGANRGDVALLLMNTLNTNMKDPVGYEGTQPVYAKLISRLAATETIQVLATSSVDKDVEEGTVMIKDDGTTMKTAIALDGYLGRKVKVYVKDDQIVAVDSVLSAEVKTFTAKNESESKVANKVYDADGNVVATKSADIPVVYNGVKTKLNAPGVVVYNGAKVTLIANEKKGEYDFAVIEDAFEYQGIVVNKDVKDGDKFINGNSALRIAGDPVKTVIVKGAVNKLTDIKKNDVIYYAKSADGSKVTILVVRDKVEGKVTKVVTGDKTIATINGKDYEVSGVTVKVDDEGTFVLNKEGKIVYFIGKAAAEEKYGIVLAAEVFGQISGGKVQLFTAAGEKKTFDAVYDVATVADGVYETNKYLVTYKGDADGKLSEIKGVGSTNTIQYMDTTYDKDNKFITISNTKYYLTESTVIFNVYNNDYKVVKLADLNKTPIDVVAFEADGYNVLKALVISEASLAQPTPETTEYAYVSKVATIKTSDGTSYEITAFAKGMKKTYTTKVGFTDTINANSVVKLQLDKNGIVVSAPPVSVSSTVTGTVEEISAGGFKIKDNNNNIKPYLFADGVTVITVDAEGKAKLGGVGDLAKGTNVTVYLDNADKAAVIKVN